MSFDTFVDSLDAVPPEVLRNFTLITDLDKRCNGIVNRVNELVKDYKKCKTRQDRLDIRAETKEIFETLSSYSDDKIALTRQTYEVIDKIIVKMLQLVKLPPTSEVETKEGTPTKQSEVPGYHMPVIEDEPTFCWCKQISHGEMVACDNPDCPVEWFHFECVGLTSKPKGDWFCVACRKVSGDDSKNNNKRRRSKPKKRW